MRGLIKELKNSRQGSALVFTLLVFVVLMILASAAVAVTGTDSQVASAQEGSKAALYVAESAVDIAKQKVMEDIDAGNAVSGSPITNVPGGEYRYDVIDEGGNKYRISAVGFAKMPNGTTATKTIDVIFKYVPAGPPPDDDEEETEDPTDPPPPPETGRRPVTGVSLSPANLQLAPGESDTLTAIVEPSNADNKNVTWETADPNVATVTASGNNKAVIEAVEVGETVITVTTEDGGFTATCNVTVKTDPPNNQGNSPFEYAVLGQGSGTGMFQLTGDIRIQGPMHSNSSIHFNNNGNNAGIEVSGPVSTTDEIKIIGQSGDFSGVEMNVGAPPVIMPEIDWDYIREHATKAFDKNTSLDGHLINDNDVIFVDGDLTLTGEVSGNALIVATGDITISGDYDYPSSDYAAVGLIAGNNLKLYGDHGGFDLPGVDGPEIQGFVIALNNVIVQGEAKATGSVISGNNMECGSGELQIEFIDGDDNPVDKVFEFTGTEIIANYDEL